MRLTRMGFDGALQGPQVKCPANLPQMQLLHERFLDAMLTLDVPSSIPNGYDG